MSRSIDTRLLGCAAVLAFTASLAVMLMATPGAPLLYWTVSAFALVIALAVLVAGERAWEDTVAKAQAAGLVASEPGH